MPGGSRSSGDPLPPGAGRRLAGGALRVARAAPRTWRRLSPEQRVAGVGCVLLIVSTFGPFSFVEAAVVLVALTVLVLLRGRALGKTFHLPFGDGTMIAAAGLWCGLLILVRLFERPLGLNLLALGCAVMLFLAGARERAKRPADDMPAERMREEREARGKRPRERSGTRGSEWPTRPLSDPATRPLPDDPPEPRRPGG